MKNKKPMQAIAALLSVSLSTAPYAQTVAPVSQLTYDLGGRLATYIEPKGQSHSFEHNAFGELVRHKQPHPASSGTLGQIEYGYNGQGTLASVRDPRGLLTEYDVNGLGETKTLISPDTGMSNATYDEAGNRTAYTDARGITVTAAFDRINRLTRIDYGDQAVDFGYDAGDGVGLLTSINDNSGSTHWNYNKFGRLLAKTQVTSGRTLEVRYTYLPGGRVETITYPSGAVVRFNYDRSQVTSIEVNGVTVISNVAYFPFGGPKSWEMGTTGTYSRTMDTAGRLTSHTSEFGTSTLTWDENSRLTAITEPGQPARSFGYDRLNRLVSASDVPASTYALDLTGNRTGATAAGTSYSYGVDAASNRLQSAAGASFNHTYSHDAAGNLLSDGTRTFAYDGAGRLTTLGGAAAARYAYNGLGQRVSKVTGAGSRLFLYAEDGTSLLGEYGPAGSTAAVHETIYLAGTPVLVLKGGSSFYVITDHLTTPRAVKNLAGETVWRWKSDAFGNGAAEENGSGLFQFTFNQRFPGQQFDAESGLHYNMARFYEPRIGRYVTSDPIGLAGGLNTYTYAYGRATTATDPSGKITVFAAAGIGAALGASAKAYSLYRGGESLSWHSAFRVLVAGAYGGFAGGVGSLGALAPMTMSRAIWINAGAGAVANAGATEAENAIIGCDIGEGVVKAALLGGVFGAFGGAAGQFMTNRGWALQASANRGRMLALTTAPYYQAATDRIAPRMDTGGAIIGNTISNHFEPVVQYIESWAGDK